MARRWLVLIAVSLVFFFITSATFMSLGVVLPSMARDLHWSQTQAGASFSALGLACCLSSLLPLALASRIGARWTMMLGGLMLVAGFLMASVARGLPEFLAATCLMGVGFTFSGNIPGVYLLARWFPNHSGRIIGVYLMSGAFGGVAGPVVAQAVAAQSGWRIWWLALTLVAAALAALCALLIRDTVDAPAANLASLRAPVASGGVCEWRYRSAVLTPQFAILALGMVVTEANVTEVHSAAVMHLTRLGMTSAFAALMLSLQALLATAAKGVSGAFGDWIDPRLLLVGGLCLEAVGMVFMASAHSAGAAYAFALTFGVGWGTAYLTITVLLIRYFGAGTGSAVLSLVWLLTGFASLAPAGAGMVADRLGTFAPAFDLGAALLIPIALAALIMRRPVAARTAEPNTHETPTEAALQDVESQHSEAAA